MQESDLKNLLRGLRHPRIHLLGSAAPQTAGRLLQTVRQHNDETEVTMDGNLLRSRLDELAGLSGEARSSKIADLLSEATAGKQEVTAEAFMGASPSIARVAAPPVSRDSASQATKRRETVVASSAPAPEAPLQTRPPALRPARRVARARPTR
jgi:hypothetical protein